MEPVEEIVIGRTAAEKTLEVLDRIFFGQVELELVLKLLVHIAIFDVRDVRFRHKSDQVQDEVCTLSQNGVRDEAQALEPGELGGLGSSHRVDHLRADFDGRWI